MVGHQRGQVPASFASAFGSGKTTLARRAAAGLGPPDAAVLPIDACYRDRPDATAAERAAANYDAPDAVDVALLEAHLAALRAGRAVERPSYDFRTHRRTRATRTVRPGRHLLVEGILPLCWPALRTLCDTTAFIRIDEETALARRMERDTRLRGRSPDSVRRQWKTTGHRVGLTAKRNVICCLPREGGMETNSMRLRRSSRGISG